MQPIENVPRNFQICCLDSLGGVITFCTISWRNQRALNTIGGGGGCYGPFLCRFGRSGTAFLCLELMKPQKEKMMLLLMRRRRRINDDGDIIIQECIEII